MLAEKFGKEIKGNLPGVGGKPEKSAVGEPRWEKVLGRGQLVLQSAVGGVNYSRAKGDNI